MKKATLPLLVFAMLACGQAPAATAPPTRSAVACRLPIYVDPADGTGPHGAFIDLPSGRMTVPPDGAGGRYYDSRFGRWLPVDAHSVSADQSHYAQGGATVDGQPYLRIVDVASSAARLYNLPREMFSAIGGTHVFEYADDMVYLGVDGDGYVAALWKFDLATGTTTFANISGIGSIDGTTVWRGALNPADPHPLSFVPGTPTDQIERLDLRDGSRQVWAYRPGHLLAVVGVDAAHEPIVSDIIDRQTVELSILPSPTTQRSIYKGSLEAWPEYVAGVLADSHGIWFGGGKGFYLVTAAGPVQKVSDQAGWPAGACA